MKSLDPLLAAAVIIVGCVVVPGCTDTPPSETHHTRPTATYSYDIGKSSYVRIYEARIDGVDYLFMGGGGAIIPKVRETHHQPEGPWWPIGTNRFGDTAFYTNRAGQRLLLRTYRDLGSAIDFTWTTLP